MPAVKNVILAAACVIAVSAASAEAAPQTVIVPVGPQYGSTHVYVALDQVDRLVTSVIATFGGHAGPAASVTVTPTPSTTISRVVFTPVGLLSVFGFQTPIPYPFGEERTGYLVTDMDKAVAAARAAGAELVVAPFADAIGRDAVVRWPGGVNMQLYWHTTAPAYAPLASAPENRLYVSADQADVFVRDFLSFSGGRVVQDDRAAAGVGIGRPDDHYRRIRLQSEFGRLTVLVTDGHLPWPYGRELTGYAVANLPDTLARARISGAEVLKEPYVDGDRIAAMVRFPGGYIAEIHAPTSR